MSNYYHQNSNGINGALQSKFKKYNNNNKNKWNHQSGGDRNNHPGNHVQGQSSQNSNKRFKKSQPESRAEMLANRSKLPIQKVKQQVIEAIKSNDVLIFLGETACGKTTQIPQFILENGLNKLEACMNGGRKCERQMIAVTQPRRVAAISVATRVSTEMNCSLGTTVGYSVRFDEKTDPSSTKIKFMTDGMLLREAILDPLLLNYSVIILDEVHERSIQTDVLFGVIKRCLDLRRQNKSETINNEDVQQNGEVENHPNLKVILMSATMDVDLFSKFFNDCPVYYLEGRQFQIEKLYMKTDEDDYVGSALVTVTKIHRDEEEGDILVFCTGQEEIVSMVGSIRKAMGQAPPEVGKLQPLPLYANQLMQEQKRVFDQVNGRKVIFSTNVAETSITIPGVKYVVDTMRVKARTFDPVTGFESLKVELISKAQAEQRAGRAGRESAGKCFRLIKEESFEKLPDFSTPEILRMELSGVLITLIAMGINNLDTFEFISSPNKSAIKDALCKLLELGAIEDDSRTENDLTNEADDGESNKSKPQKSKNESIYSLTSLGKEMVIFPLDPRYSKMLIASSDFNCCEEIIGILSCLYVESVFHIPAEKREKAIEITKKFDSSEGDHIKLLNVLRAYISSKDNRSWCFENFINNKNMIQVSEVRKQLLRLFEKTGRKKYSIGNTTQFTKVRECIFQGLRNNVAIFQREGFYQTVQSKEIVFIHPSSCLFNCKPEAVMYTDIVDTSKKYMRNVSLIDINWIKKYGSQEPCSE